ncbi:hypothetical protein BJY52DRAFT_1320684 [Lactarius psammicola]|nr:hypothetical protein BJY52DRAFT_1320684 [Lactarius psammicola]
MSSSTFGPPFDHADANTILRSSDRVDFPVFRDILSTSSPFFKSMFSLPQPDASILEKRPVIDMTENSKTIAVLLTFIYPVVSVATEPESLDDLIDAFVAAKKYDMAVVSHRLVQKFAESNIVRDNPIVAFCAAYSHELGDAARVAAKASLKHRMNLDNIGDMLQHTNGPAFHRLYKFHRACSTTAAEAVSGSHLTWITSSPHTWWNPANDIMCQSNTCVRYHYTVGPSRYTWDASAPCYNYITRARNALLEHPCSEAVTHHVFLKLSYVEPACFPCRLDMLGLAEFSRLLGEEVERRVSKVDLDLPF